LHTKQRRNATAQGGNYRVKLLKLLIVPAVLVFSLVMAGPVFAHNVINATVTTSCENGQICVTLTGSTTTDTQKRIVKLELFGDDTKVGETTLTVPAFDQAHPQFTAKGCFPAVTNGNFNKFSVKVVNVVDENGNDADLTVADNQQKVIFSFDADHRAAVVLFKDLQPCNVPTPTPQTPTPTASAAVTTTLAGTGGFDFRYPLVGLTVLVAGLALLLVSASRGRSSTK